MGNLSNDKLLIIVNSYFKYGVFRTHHTYIRIYTKLICNMYFKRIISKRFYFTIFLNTLIIH